MTQTNDSFIDEVTEEVRRERFSRWLRRYGWMVALAAVLVVALAAWIEWRQSQARVEAEDRGEALLSALETEDAPARLAALSALPAPGDGSVLGPLLLAAEHEAQGDLGAARAAFEAVAADGATPPLYRDLARLKAAMIAAQDPADLEASRLALEALAAPGAPFRLLARETLATAELVAGNEAAALAALDAILEDADVTPSQQARVEGLRLALGGAPAEAAAPEVGAEPALTSD